MTEPELDCPHDHIQPSIDITRYAAEPDPDNELDAWMAHSVMVAMGLFCTLCGKQFTVLGVEPGMNWNRAGTNPECTTVFVPMTPPGTLPTDGLPVVDFGHPWKGAPDVAVEAIIQRAIREPGKFIDEIPGESGNKHKARAATKALGEFLSRAG